LKRTSAGLEAEIQDRKISLSCPRFIRWHQGKGIVSDVEEAKGRLAGTVMLTGKKRLS